jgi:hypothetical protein
MQRKYEIKHRIAGQRRKGSDRKDLEDLVLKIQDTGSKSEKNFLTY